jgi:hypothetical protein
MVTMTSIRNSQLRDQFSDHTRTVRRNLLIFSGAALLLGLPQIELGQFLGLNLSGPGAAGLAIGAIASIAAYEFISFVIYGAIDHARWRIEPGAIMLNSASESLRQLSAPMMSIRSILGEFQQIEITAAQVQRIQTIVDEATRAVAQYHGDMSKHHRQLAKHNIMQLIRIYCIDWTIPLLVGALSVIANFESIHILMRAVAREFQ